MRYKVLIRPEAEADLRDAYFWYEDKRQGLGSDFLLHVEAGLDFIEKMPEIHAPGYKGTRMHLIKRFPYKIIYMINQDTILILAILHEKRDPALIRK